MEERYSSYSEFEKEVKGNEEFAQFVQEQVTAGKEPLVAPRPWVAKCWTRWDDTMRGRKAKNYQQRKRENKRVAAKEGNVSDTSR